MIILEDKAIILENALPDEVLAHMEKVLLTYFPIPSFIDGTNIDKSMRDSEVRFMQYNSSNSFVRKWLENMSEEYCSFFPYSNELEGTQHSKGSLVPEPVQVTTYRMNNFYDWHVDGGAHDARHMTLIAQLTDSSEYEGGDFEIEDLTLPPFTRNKGTVLLMKPHLKHRVTPVTKGVRNSMITWFRNEFKEY